MSEFIFPLRQRPVQDYHSGGRQFGANRGDGRKHAACDLIAPAGTEILAMADGEIMRGPTYFYSGTYALEVKHDNGKVVRYGEIAKIVPPGIKVGARVSQGQVIARVGRLASGNSMLHLELYSGTQRGSLTQAGNKYKRRSDLTDPTPYLDAAPLLSERDMVEAGEGRVNDHVVSVLNVRETPSTIAKEVDELHRGDIVKVLEEITGDVYQWDRNDWLKIECNGSTGFVAGYYVDLGRQEQPQGVEGGEQPTGRWEIALLEARPRGASATTAGQDQLTTIGVDASQQLAEKDLDRVVHIADRFVSVAGKFGIPAAVLAALASRESRCGNVLHNGWGDHRNAFGIMQVDKRFHHIEGLPEPASLEHIAQAAGIFTDFLEEVIQQHSSWADKHLLQGAAVAYNSGVGNVQTIEGMDNGTTGDDYGSDVLARAQYYFKHPELSIFRA